MRIKKLKNYFFNYIVKEKPYICREKNSMFKIGSMRVKLNKITDIHSHQQLNV